MIGEIGKNEGLEEEDRRDKGNLENRDSKMKNRENVNAENINNPRTVIACYEHRNHKARVIVK